MLHFRGLIHTLGMTEVVKFCRQVAYIKSYQRDNTSPPKGKWLWSHDLFKFLVSLKYP